MNNETKKEVTDQEVAREVAMENRKRREHFRNLNNDIRDRAVSLFRKELESELETITSLPHLRMTFDDDLEVAIKTFQSIIQAAIRYSEVLKMSDQDIFNEFELQDLLTNLLDLDTTANVHDILREIIEDIA